MIFPREPLNHFQRKKLEKQFVQQVPEFSEYGNKKLSFERNSFFSSLAGAAIFGFRTMGKTSQPLAGLFVGGVAFVTFKLVAQTFGPIYNGLNQYDKNEYERGFNLWLYYKDKPVSPIEGATKRYEERFNAWKSTNKL